MPPRKKLRVVLISEIFISLRQTTTVQLANQQHLFSDSQREFFWKEKERLINQIIEIKADAITKSQDGKLWSARFPRFKTFRGFEKNEKI